MHLNKVSEGEKFKAVTGSKETVGAYHSRSEMVCLDDPEWNVTGDFKFFENAASNSLLWCMRFYEHTSIVQLLQKNIFTKNMRLSIKTTK